MAGPSLLESLFQRSLEDLIKGLRLYVGDESTFISKAVDEIRREIKSTDQQTKATALQKLTYLHSIHGVDMSWAAFHAIELSSSQSFNFKRIAYLAASLSFDPSTTDVILLLTHQLRKDLSSPNPHEVSLALHTLCFISTADLARDLTPEVFTLLNSNKGSTRKKAIAIILRLFELYPDAVRVCFKRLIENLENSDPAIVSAVVGVFCELASKEPKSYLPLAPEFYKILVDSRNNWLLIKVLKICVKLAPLEPRLGKRLVEPICEHLRRTGAKSLSFECVRTIVSSFSEYDSAVKLSVEKIREFLNDDDPNLKYLGLQALTIVAPKHLWPVIENKDFVIKSLSDADANIKLEALQLVMAMVSEDNVAEICRVLINYALKSDPEFCNEILGCILLTCSRNVYEIIVDFDWYVSLLGEMSRVLHCQKGEEIENQLADIGMRVKDARPELVRVGRDLLNDPALLGNPFIHPILSAAAWVSGEYVRFSKNPLEIMEALLQPRTSLLPPSIKAVYIQSAFKVLTFYLHYAISTKEVISSASQGVADIMHGAVQENSQFVRAGFVAESDSDDGGLSHRMMLHRPVRDVSVESFEDMAVARDWLSSTSFKGEPITEESIVNILNLVETTLGPLAGSHGVEILERSRNVLGLVELVREELPGYLVKREEDNDKGQRKTHEMIKLIAEAFSEELGPVSASSQERVPIPEGMMLNQSLNDLDAICGDFELHIPTSFSLGRSISSEKDDVTMSDRQGKEEFESTESTSLLAEHRKRHGLYYLQSQKKETINDEYPPANDLKTGENADDKADDLIKLTEQSLFPKKKTNQAKPRPVVVKLDDGDGPFIPAKKVDSKDDLISGAVRDVLFGDEATASSSRTKKSDKSSSKRRQKDKLDIDKSSGPKEDSKFMENSELENANLRRSKRHSRGKEKKHRSNAKDKDEHEEGDKQKVSHHHGKHKSRQRAEGALTLAAQSPVIPDFLL
ncbi:AP-3 complex subunit delta [Nicotiana tomentosiformis]|uniref:AP-3 complex subunit delta n=1 Tax=Nicotiana tomentosiformis TaxID=4098 RepID=UPI00051BCD63|nr:AP-3 complex subunit delta [Nicotiana tomentosiformis]